MQENSHLFYMQRALQLAALGRFTVAPNPMVGCILVKNHQIIGEGFHQRAGEPHAEVYALKNARENTQGATAYVTLEPCCHTGRTPPCTQALIAAGIKTVYVACLDPNPLVAGKGVETLKAAGIEVHLGLCEQEAIALNKVFFHFIQTHRPYVICKWAMSFDGKTITHPEDDRLISCHDSQQHSHQIRQAVDAIVIGAKTASQDNPLLTIRHAEATKQPLRFILASKGNLPLDLKIFAASLPSKTIIVTTPHADTNWLKAAKAKNIEIWQCATKDEQIDLQDFLTKLGQAHISSILVEGGESLHASFFAQTLVNEVQVYLAPKIISKLTQKKPLFNLTTTSIGSDIFLTATCSTDPCLPKND
jgi:diaminohydroxyphosphoribosylaminopyrimidine deaminase/5-amino-6-(5-phosphoribosylamino)uracil reductase